MNQMEKIQALKKEKDAAILAHYYVPEEVQEAADRVAPLFRRLVTESIQAMFR